MSFKCKLSSLHKEQKSYIKNICVATPKITQYNPEPQSVFTFKVIKVAKMMALQKSCI